MGIVLSCSGNIARFPTFESVINQALNYITAASCAFSDDELKALVKILARAKNSYNMTDPVYPWVVTNKKQWYIRTRTVLANSPTVETIYANSTSGVPNTTPLANYSLNQKLDLAAVYFIISFLFNYDQVDNGFLSLNNNVILQYYASRANTVSIDGDFINNIVNSLGRFRFGTGALQGLSLANNSIVTFSTPMFLVRGSLQEILPQTAVCNTSGGSPSTFGPIVVAPLGGVVIRGGTYISRVNRDQGCVLCMSQEQAFLPSMIINMIGRPRPFRAIYDRNYLEDASQVPSSFSSDNSSDDESEDDSVNSEYEYLDPTIPAQFVGQVFDKGHCSSSSSSSSRGKMVPGTLSNYSAEILTEVRHLNRRLRPSRLRRIIRQTIQEMNSVAPYFQGGFAGDVVQ